MERHEDLDFLKGMGIAFVVLGHCITTALEKEYIILGMCKDIIYTFHMPLFFIVSGYLQGVRPYKRDQLKKYTVHQTKKLFVPYMLWSIILYLFYYLLQTVSVVKIPETVSLNPINLIRDILNFHVKTGNVLWYVYILFIAANISYLIHIFMNRKSINIIFLFAVLALGFTANSFLTEDIFVLRRFLVMWIYYEIGVFIGKYIKDISVKTVIWQEFFLLLVYIVLFIGYINSNSFMRHTLKFLCALIAVYICYSLSKYSLSRFYKAMSYMGKRTSYIYYMHNPYIVLISVTGLTEFTSINVGIVIAAAFILGCTIPLTAGELILSRNKAVKNIFIGG